MDPPRYALLTTDIAAQQTIIHRIYTLLRQRAEGLTIENPEKLESVAYQLHNLYGAIEELFKVIATYFENQITDAGQRHSRLLQRMSQPVPGVRPAIISEESYLLLNSLRAFRHCFRHAYGVPIDHNQLLSNLEKAYALDAKLSTDIQIFLSTLERSHE
ncbi:hypothetical protein XM38_020440 [Halomicronema hongdechloris C2206]|uniref:HepT-like domain-containing protein n=1 Tax=Halomicronema hongdechloris C2206 TaxID=1641165 RepID=A0A1Z3HLB5_9CYAN|nr:hypothetical protein [Halomicronema hongdechloris]ASC71094.1 hypothetical protein XM38_020440 [Halomicronema hongdechloris C2206]